MSFGRSVGGGRRAEPRRIAPLTVTLSTTSRHRPALLLDVSASGARLQLDNPPAVGQQLYVTLGPLQIFGEVRWTTPEQCGLGFDEPLSATELSQVMVESIGHRRPVPPVLDRRVFRDRS